MLPINNSDTAWLIVADYNQENDIRFPEELREDVLNPEINDWEIIYFRINHIPGDNCIIFIGDGCDDGCDEVGSAYGRFVGTGHAEVGDDDNDSVLVGGNYDPDQ